jgi:lipopolysaccharide/colanic/teichoic acid biosynthesis glycosyltransferase
MKRLFDLFFSFIGLVLLCVPMIILIVLATISTGKFGLYSQIRIGLHGNPFIMYKIRSMLMSDDMTVITLKNDSRITRFGQFLRLYNLDELPQLFNVFMGDMSLVGPRPDVAGYADALTGDDKIILELRPGITGPATLKYKNEENLLMEQKNPRQYNDEVIWKDKVDINKKYIENWSLIGDIRIILKTFFN